jgi:putative Mn2+ efflux pump MntP
MQLTELFLIAVSLSMDAFAVSICKGLAAGKKDLRGALTVGAWFGGFQALMPTLGWALGSRFAQHITSIDHWIAFALLVLIGGNMIREACSEGEEEADASLDTRVMLALAVATSIDALAVGVTFAFLSVSIVPAVCLIGATTFVLSAIGYQAGSRLGDRFQKRAEIAGGAILVLLGVKILCEHLGIFTI